MSTALQVIQEKVQLLSPQKQRELLGSIERMLDEEKPRKRHKPIFDWIGDSEDSPDSTELNGDAQTFDPSKDNKRNLAFDWIVDPNADPEPFTSVELQHMATQWMIQDELDLK